MTLLWLRLWWWVRGRALKCLRDEFPAEYRDSFKAWEGSDWRNLPSGMADDRALYDAAKGLGLFKRIYGDDG